MQDYGVVFAGQLREGVRPEEARANLARLLRIEDPARLDRLFSGKPVVIKKGLDADQARRYEAALRQAGVVCELRRAAPASPAPATPPAAAPAPARAAPPPAPSGLALAPLADEAAAPAPARPALSLEPLALALVEDAPAATAAPAAAPAPGPATARPAVAMAAATFPAATPRPAPAATASTVDEPPAIRNRVIKGSGSGYGDSSIIPDEIKGLCWGGFFMPWLWGAFNGVQITFLALPGMGILRRVLPRSVLMGVSLLLSLFMLVKGRELAWQYKTWDSVEHFNRVQRRWSQAGLAFMLVLAVVIPSCVAREQREQKAMAAELARLEAEAKAEEAASAAENAAATTEEGEGAQDPGAPATDAAGSY